MRAVLIRGFEPMRRIMHDHPWMDRTDILQARFDSPGFEGGVARAQNEPISLRPP